MTVVELGREDVPEIVDVFCDAFRDYPVMRFVLGESEGDYDVRLATLIHLFVMARSLRGEPMFGIREASALAAAASTSDPAGPESPAELGKVREACWQALGLAARERYERCGSVWQALSVTAPRVHLNMIGVRPGHQGHGLGGLLLRRVHELSRATPGSEGVSLTTEDPGNVPFYERAGYEVVGHARIAPELETWSFFRPT